MVPDKVQSRQRSPQAQENRMLPNKVQSRQRSPQAHESRMLPNKVQSRQRSPQAHESRMVPDKVQSRQRSPQAHESRMVPNKVQSRQRSPQAHESRMVPNKVQSRQRSPQAHESRMVPDKVQSRQRSPQAHESRILPNKIQSRQRSPQAYENRVFSNKVDSRQRSPQAYDDRVHTNKIQPRQHSPPTTHSPSLKSRDKDSSKSPPRGPSSLRSTIGPSCSHPSGVSAPASASFSKNSITSRQVTSNSNSTVTPVVPPAGPRGYFPRGGSSIRGGRTTPGSDWVSKSDNTRWGAAPPLNRIVPIDTNQKGNTPSGQKVLTPSPSLSSTPFVAPAPSNSSTGIPTGPRAGISSRTSLSLQHPSVYNRTTQSVASNSGSRQHPALANMISIIPGGRIDPTASAIVPDIATRLKRKAEEEVLREELHAKEEKLRLSLKQWKKLSKDSVAMELKSYLSEKHVRTLAGEGFEGSAF
ncbi:hypothetical protein BGHDH14_bgh01827 [Blumeria hordei DH14]|uniref:Uncharacterized protein n=1 Tax=Blumeria graminis f. sp. hordei (strain DH14) TaxID=546991 RepID=N1JE62_BLUG1|nr:hypothetical protein BGHDH14_bgh01827 [Blumeria hordei DH14]